MHPFYVIKKFTIVGRKQRMSYEVKNEQLVKWVAEVAALCGPDKIH